MSMSITGLGPNTSMLAQLQKMQQQMRMMTEQQHGLPGADHRDAQLLRQSDLGDCQGHHSRGLHSGPDHLAAGAEGRQYGGGPYGSRQNL